MKGRELKDGGASAGPPRSRIYEEVRMNRRKTDQDGGWYERIPVPGDDTRPTCTRCGARAGMVDRADGVCIVCKLEERKPAREASP